MRKKPTQKVFRQVCEARGANITQMAIALKTHRSTIHLWLEKDEKFRQIYDEVRESFIDLCESQLVNMVKGIPKYTESPDGTKQLAGWTERPSEAAIIFSLKTRGKERGYVERYDFTSKGEKIGMTREEIEAEINRIDNILKKSKGE